MDDLPPPVSLDGVLLPPIPAEPFLFDAAGSNDQSPPKNSTRQEGSKCLEKEKEDSSAESAPEATGSPAIKRPLNRFFLYKVWAQPHYVKAYPGLSNQVISKMISRDWHNRPDHVKDHFAQLAVWEKAKHAQQYPNYKYQPKTNRSVKRKFEKSKDKPEVAKPENAKPPIESLHSSKGGYSTFDPRAYSLNRPHQFANFSMPNQYELYGNPSDRPLYPELSKMLPLFPEGVDQYLQQMEMESASRAHAANARRTQFQQPGMQEPNSAGWHDPSRGVHGGYFGTHHNLSDSSKDSVEFRMSLTAPFPVSSAGSDAKMLSAYQSFIKSQCETLPSGHIRSEYAHYTTSSSSEAPDSSELSDTCMGDVEDYDDNTTIYDTEIELLQQRLLELRRLKLRTTQQKANRQINDHRRSSECSNSTTMSEGGTRRSDTASKQEALNNMFQSPPTATPAESSNSQYTQAPHYSTESKAGNNPMNPASSSDPSFNFYNSLSPLSNTISAYLSNAISAEDTTEYLRQLIADDPVDHPIVHQRGTSLPEGSIGHPIPEDFSDSVSLLGCIKREAPTDNSEDDGKKV